jgi:hypothetical protein
MFCYVRQQSECVICWIQEYQKAVCMTVEQVNQPRLKTPHSVTTVETIQELQSHIQFQCRVLHLARVVFHLFPENKINHSSGSKKKRKTMIDSTDPLIMIEKKNLELLERDTERDKDKDFFEESFV